MTEAEQAKLLTEFHAFSRLPPATHIAKLKKEWTGKDGQLKRMVLDYVGHADATDLLLTCDPFWNWEPPTAEELKLLGYESALVRDKEGWPRGLWIALTVHGVRRLGFGSCEPKKPDAVKELIGDAIRNASMRFGLALALWSKAEWDETPPILSQEAPPLPGEIGAGEPQASSQDASEGGAGSQSPAPFDFRPAVILARELGLPDELRHKLAKYITGRTESVKEMNQVEFSEFMTLLRSFKDGVIPEALGEIHKEVVEWLAQSTSRTKTLESSS